MTETVALTQGLPSQLGPGRVVAGKYRLEEMIGRGSMGTVFRASHVTLGQRVAIKLISAEHSPSAEARRRFALEAQAAAKLRSRHVVQVYDHGETPEGNPYIVLELLEGETLEQRMRRERDLSLADATRVVAHVARALARAHAEGIVHRDLKPANIFLVKTEDDEGGWLAKVVDFGIAKLEGPGQQGNTQAGTVLGTPLFMSPEQVLGASSVDHRADLYSLGMCFYHMLTGDFAFYSPNFSEVLVAICTQPLPSLRAQAPWVSEAVEAWFQRACARDPLARFQSADEMSEALLALAGATPLDKHKSFPEGRLAPETLTGFAAPPALGVLERAGASALAQTQRLPPVPAWLSAAVPADGATNRERVPPPIAVSVSGGDARGGTQDLFIPTRRVHPLAIALGLGVLALATVALTLGFLGRMHSSDDRAARGTASASRSLSPSVVEPAPPSNTGAASVPPPPPALSSVAAEPPPRAPSTPNTEATAPEKTLNRRPRGDARRPTPGTRQADGTDLGF